jgi:hypothetical protein
MAENYFFNRLDRYFVRSVGEPTRIDPPEWGYGDVKAITVTFVDPTPKGRVEVVTSLSAVQVAIGTPGSAPITTATATTPSAAFAYPITIPLNVAGVNTFLGSELRKAATLEFMVTDSVGPNRYRSTLYIFQQLNTGAVADTAPGDSALGVQQARGIYVPQDGVAGASRVLRSPSGYRVLEYYGDDKQMHYDPID